MAELTQLEKYLRNIPLTDELAELRDGPQAESAYERVPFRVANEPISDGEIRSLRQLRDLAGWSTLMKLLDSRLAQVRGDAILLSETDPVGKREEVTRAWLYANAWKWVRGELDNLIDEAILAGQPEQQKPMETEDDETRVD